MSQDNPLVSVVTTCRNAQRTIERTLQSVLTQSYPHLEYWVIDAVSQDNTRNILDKYMPRFEGRMRFVSEPDRGIYDGFNKGVSRCSGTLIGILNSDDWYEPDTVANIVASYLQHPQAVVFYGIARMWDEAGERELRLLRRHHATLPQGMTGHPGVFISRAAYQECRGYSLDFQIASDYDLLARLYARGCCFAPVDKILVNTRVGGASDKRQLVGDLESAAIRRQYGFISRSRHARLIALAWARHLRRESIKGFMFGRQGRPR